MMSNSPRPNITRRSLLIAGTGLSLAAVSWRPVWATPDDVAAAQTALFGDRSMTPGRISLTLPPIAENGYSVPLDVDVESPMTPDDHVVRIAIFAPRNPLPTIAQFHLGPRAGKARVSTRIRLGASQTLSAVAEMNDGSLWIGSAETVVTLAACVVL